MSETDRLPLKPINLREKKDTFAEDRLLANQIQLFKLSANELLRSDSKTNLAAVLEGFNMVVENLRKIKPLGQ